VSTAVPGVGAPSCARCGGLLEDGDLRCAVCSLPTAAAAGARGVVAEVLRCDDCGAALAYDVAVQAPRCGFCGGVAHLERSEDPIESAEAYLPFRVDPATAERVLRQWMAGLGFFRPADLATASTLEKLKPLWWVGWTFDARALVSWAADSDAGAGRSAWAPHAGQLEMDAQAVLVSASRGLSQEETQALTGAFDLRTAQPAPHPMEGAVIERFDVQRSAAREIVAHAVEGYAAGQARRYVPGRKLRNLRVAVLLRRLTTRRYAFPSYVLAYRYDDRLYRAVVHGQDASVVIGQAPYSYVRIALVVLAVVGGLALVAFLLFAAAGVAAMVGG
jgi:hypothetical protein